MLPLPAEPIVMARTNKLVATACNPIRGESVISDWEIVDSNPTPEPLRQQAAVFLDSERLLLNIRGLTPEDQIKLLEKVDKVYSDGSFFYLETS